MESTQKGSHQKNGTSLLLQQLLVQTKLLVEAADASAGIHDLLLAGEEGVALGANFYLDVALSRASLDDIAAGAPDGGLIVVGMQSFLHGVSPLSHPGYPHNANGMLAHSF